MDEWAALRLALDLLHDPWGVRVVRGRPLPDGIVQLLNVAAGDAASEAAAVAASGQPREAVRQAATFFIEQVLLAPDADCYRVLGARPSATNGELRRNMALIMRWLHPDVAREGDQTVFAARIAEAWNTLKTPERRAAYDGAQQQPRVAREPRSGTGRSRRSSAPRAPRKSSLPRLLAFFLLGRRTH
jgi:DnaJ domain